MDTHDLHVLMAKKLLTPAEIAALLQVKESTVRAWARRHSSMPRVQAGKLLRFEEEPVLEWLRGGGARLPTRVPCTDGRGA